MQAPTFLAISGATGARVEAKAVAQGADGHFVATVTLPSGGYWTWQVQLTELIVETPPQAIAVTLADGTMPAMDTGAMLSAIERVRSEIRTEYQAQLFSETDGLRTKIGILESKVTSLQHEREVLAKQVATLSAPAAPAAPAGALSVAVPAWRAPLR